MPIKSCNENGKPGFKWGNTKKCWTYDEDDEQSKKTAKRNCIRQALAIEGPENFSSKAQEFAKEFATEYTNKSEYYEDLLNVACDLDMSISDTCGILLQVFSREELKAFAATYH